MPRRKAATLTQREAQIMTVLWGRGEATAEQVRTALSDSPHDSSVRTLLRVLESKGYVRHDLRGKAYVYRPLVPRERAQKTAAKSLLEQLFAGSAENLVLRLIEENELSAEQLEEIVEEVRKVSEGRAGTRGSEGKNDSMIC
jgi:predicted transcriptional regulator